MKYKVGDKVLLKSWEQIQEEFDTSCDEISLPSNRIFTRGMRRFVENSPDRIVTITSIFPALARSAAGYEIKEYSCYWDDFMIVGLAKEVIEEEIYKPPLKRWQILDIRCE